MKTGAARGAIPLREPVRWGTVLAALWAFAMAAHLSNVVRGPLDVVSAISLTAALWTLARPGSGHRLALLGASQVVDTVWHLPDSPDHQVLAVFVNTLIVWTYLTHRSTTSDELMEMVAPGARIVLLVAYTAAAASKFNSSFLDPLESCATYLGNVSTFGVIDRSDSMAWSFVVGSLAAETMIALGLLFRPTRRWAVVVGIGFHLWLCLNPRIAVGDFSAVLWALFVAFAVPEDVAAVGTGIARRLDAFHPVRDLRRIPAPLTVAMAVTAVVVGGRHVSTLVAVYCVVWASLVTCGIALLVGFAQRTVLARAPAPRIAPVRPAHVVAAALALVLAASPYLGFATSMRFTMFSNLRTEGPGTNHLFLPSFHLTDTQNEWFVVHEWTYSDADHAAGINPTPADYRAALPVDEARRLLEDRARGGLLETEDGELIRVAPGQDHALRGGAPWWERHTQKYRFTSIPGTSREGFCSN